MPQLHYATLPLGGGLNTRDNPLNIGDSQFTTLSTWDYSRQGSLTNRFARTDLFTVSGGANPSGVGEVLVGATPTRYLVYYIQSTGAVRNSSDLATETGLNLFQFTTSGRMVQWDVLNQTAYFVNGVDTPQQWTGATATTVVSSVSAMPAAQLIRMYKNYCFVANTAANPSRVFFSAIRDATTWPTNNFQDVSPNDGDSITALFGVPEGLLVFKQRSVWLMAGDIFDATNPQWRLTKLLGAYGVGTVAPDSVQFLSQSGVLFLGQDGIYQWNGQSLSKVSGIVERSMEAVSPYRIGAGVNGVGGTAIRAEAKACIFRNRYWVTISQLTIVSPSLWDIFVFDGQSWFMWSGGVIYALANYNNRLLSSATSGGNPVIQEQEVIATGGGASSGYAVADAYSKFHDFGDSTRLKHFRRVWLFFGFDNAFASPTITVSVIPDVGSTVSITLSPTTGTSLGTFGNETMRWTLQEINLQARWLQFRYQSSATSVTDSRILSAIHRVIVEYTQQGVQGGTL